MVLSDRCSYGTSLKLFVNGTNTGYAWNGSPDSGDTVFNSDGSFRIGADWGSSSETDGLIDEIKLSNVARTDGWIATEYANQTCPPPSFPKAQKKDPANLSSTLLSMKATAPPQPTVPAEVIPAPWPSHYSLLASRKHVCYRQMSILQRLHRFGNCCQYRQKCSIGIFLGQTQNQRRKPFGSGWRQSQTHRLTGTITATGFTALYVNGQVSSTLTANAWQHIVATTATPFNASSIKIGNVTQPT